MKTYVTFGSNHFHKIGDQIFDGNCVAAIECDSPPEGREKAFALFGPKFSFEYPEDRFNWDSMKYFPRGIIEVDL